jgi:hypothetical protein
MNLKISNIEKQQILEMHKRAILGDDKPLMEQSTGCGDPKSILQKTPNSFYEFTNTVKTQKTACGSNCPTVKGNTAQDFANKYTENIKYLWGGLASLYEPTDLYMFDGMNNEIVNLVLAKYGAPWRISSDSRPRIETA